MVNHIKDQKIKMSKNLQTIGAISSAVETFIQSKTSSTEQVLITLIFNHLFVVDDEVFFPRMNLEMHSVNGMKIN